MKIILEFDGIAEHDTYCSKIAAAMAANYIETAAKSKPKKVETEAEIETEVETRAPAKISKPKKVEPDANENDLKDLVQEVKELASKLADKGEERYDGVMAYLGLAKVTKIGELTEEQLLDARDKFQKMFEADDKKYAKMLAALQSKL